MDNNVIFALQAFRFLKKTSLQVKHIYRNVSPVKWSLDPAEAATVSVL